MIGIATSSNSVYVSMIPTGCCKGEFDSTYPVHLNGIISQDEYRQSIARINRIITSNKMLIIPLIIFAICMIVGIIFYIVGGVTPGKSGKTFFPPLIAAGIGVTFLGSILYCIGLFIVQSRLLTQIRKAIAEESTKYSTRSPTPCSWRLETATYFFGGYGNRQNRQLVNRIVIDIGRSTVRGNEIPYTNQGVNESKVFFRTEPPPYSAQSAEYCSQCGIFRHDLTAKFCSSCGQAFNRY